MKKLLFLFMMGTVLTVSCGSKSTESVNESVDTISVDTVAVDTVC